MDGFDRQSIVIGENFTLKSLAYSLHSAEDSTKTEISTQIYIHLQIPHNAQEIAINVRERCNSHG